MAGHHDREPVAGTGARHRAGSSRRAEFGGQARVAARLAFRDPHQRVPDPRLEYGADEVQLDLRGTPCERIGPGTQPRREELVAPFVDALEPGAREFAPQARFHYLQLCDAPTIEATVDQMKDTARQGRLYPGEGVAPIREVVGQLPGRPLAIEVAHPTRAQALGWEGFARECLARTRALLGEEEQAA